MVELKKELPEIFEEFAEQRKNSFLAIKEIKEKDIPVVGETTCDGKKTMYELLADFKPVHVVDLVLQACHTYNVETAVVKKLVKGKKGIPYTVVETDYSQADIEQINTRMAAFIEMM